MRKLKQQLLLLAFPLGMAVLLGNAACSNDDSAIDKSTVQQLDLQKYLGTWYEIARYDHRFERDLVGVKAEYSLRPDGKIKVLNSGYENTLDGAYSEAVGKAKIPDPLNEPGKLKVAFFWLFYANYFVLELDEDYQWALIGSSSDKYLWILSRTPQITPERYAELCRRLEQRGYDTAQLIRVEQHAPAERISRH